MTQASFELRIPLSSSRMLSWFTQHAMLAWVAHAATLPLFHHLLLLSHACSFFNVYVCVCLCVCLC